MELKEKKKPKSAKAKALSLLARRSYFSKELFTKLQEQGWEKKEIEKALQELTEIGLINDEELSERFVERKKQQGYGARVIAYQLKERAGRTLALTENKEELKEFIEKKYARVLSKNKPKVFQSLCRRGFSYALIAEVLGSWKELQS